MLQQDEKEVMVFRIAYLEVIEEKRQEAQDHLAEYTRRMQRAYNKKVRVRIC